MTTESRKYTVPDSIAPAFRINEDEMIFELTGSGTVGANMIWACSAAIPSRESSTSFERDKIDCLNISSRGVQWSIRSCISQQQPPMMMLERLAFDGLRLPDEMFMNIGLWIFHGEILACSGSWTLVWCSVRDWNLWLDWQIDLGNSASVFVRL